MKIKKSYFALISFNSFIISAVARYDVPKRKNTTHQTKNIGVISSYLFIDRKKDAINPAI